MTVRLDANRPPERFYRGGARLASMRGESVAPEFEPEDWVGSTTTIFGESSLGLTRLPNGWLLRDAIVADPVPWLGARHVAKWGDDLMLLVKLLDAGQRLPVHAHPGDEFAARHLGHAHGKAEAWFILEGGTVHLGLRQDVSAKDLATVVAQQDADALLGLLHSATVSPGDVVWVPPGELHAIGAGVLLLELQQPEDLSVLLEWKDFAIDGESAGHLGLGFETALRAVNRRALVGGAQSLISHSTSPGSVLPIAADPFFRLERIEVRGRSTIDEGFAICVVIAGSVDVAGVTAPLGSTLLLSASDGRVSVRGDGTVLIARPPVA